MEVMLASENSFPWLNMLPRNFSNHGAYPPTSAPSQGAPGHLTAAETTGQVRKVPVSTSKLSTRQQGSGPLTSGLERTTSACAPPVTSSSAMGKRAPDRSAPCIRFAMVFLMRVTCARHSPVAKATLQLTPPYPARRCRTRSPQAP